LDAGNGLEFGQVLPVYRSSPKKVIYGPNAGLLDGPQTIYYGFKPVATPYGNISNDITSAYSFHNQRYGSPPAAVFGRTAFDHGHILPSVRSLGKTRNKLRRKQNY